MRARARPVRSSHRMLANARRSNNAIMSSADSLGPCCKHFFPCDGTGTLTDIKGGVTFTSANIKAGTTPNSQNCLAWGTFGVESLTSGSWYKPNGKDTIIIACGRALNGGNQDGGGHLSFYMGSTGHLLKVQPYYSVFIDDNTNAKKGLATLRSQEFKIREHGKVYAFAAVMRGNMLEHWAVKEGSSFATMTDAQSVLNASSNIQAAWKSFAPGDAIALGHSAAGGFINSCGANELDFLNAYCDFGYSGYPVQPYPPFIPNGYSAPGGDRKQLLGTFGDAILPMEVAQDYMFLASYTFQDGMPNDIDLALPTMMYQAIAGRKVGYLPWATL